MRKEKGFTLIELLAVIVILAIISLIAVPIVLNIIKGAKESSKRASVDMYAKAIENSLIKGMTPENIKIETGIYKTSESNPEKLENEKGEEAKYKITYTGNKVYCEYIEIGEKGTVYVSKCKVGKSNGEYVMLEDAYYSSGTNKEGNLKEVTTKENYIVMKDAIKSNVVDYKIYGNSIQDGTPSLDNPIEIQSVGNKPINLVDTNNILDSTGGLQISYNNDGTVNLRGTLRSKFAYSVHYKKVNIPIGTILSTRGFFEGTSDETYVGVVLYNENKDKIIKQFNSFKSGEYSTYKVPENVYYLGIVWRLPNNKIGDYYEINNIKIQLQEGNTLSDWEPYGYKIPITVSNGNESKTTNIYLDEPLRKVGDVVDYIDLKNKQVVRNVKVNDTTGTKSINESYSKQDSTKEDISLPDINLFEGYNKISIDTKTSPSKFDISYKKK